MSTTIDNRVVEMEFDNSRFERNVATSMSTLDKLKQSLNFTGASKGLENVNSAAGRVDFSGMNSGIEAVHAKFSALQVMAVTALGNITNSAVNAGKRIASALTIDPIKTGFSEYETQINAVQTILANTKSKGTNIDDVNGALDELNTYADKTIYNFTEMTRNIGTFTAAGVDLDKSVSSIKGIANLAAVSGSSSQQASTAMYQLSQALAAGKVQLMDWNSVVNAGMGGQVFQDALKRTAKNMGTDVDALIKKYGSFRESLTKGEWLTAEVLTETLSQLSGAYTEADLLAKGYTKEQTAEILDLAKTAEEAATKVKTFTQLWDTLKEAAQSGWTQTWEILIGDFEEAKETLTKVSDTFNEIIGKSAEARNKLLQGWKDAGGRDDLLAGFANAFKGITNIAKPIKEAFGDIFPPATVGQLTKFTEGFKKLTASFAEFTSSRADKIKSTFKGLFSILSIGVKALGAVGKAVGALLTSEGFVSLVDLLLDATAALGDFFTSLNKGFETGGISGGLSNLVDLISDLLFKSTNGVRSFADAFSAIGRTIVDIAGKIWDGLSTVFTWITDNVSAGDIFAGLTGGGIYVLFKKFSGIFDGISDIIDKFSGGPGSIKEKISDILGSVHDSLNSFATGIKVGSLVSIAIAVGILSASLNTISKLSVKDISKSLFSIGMLLAMLNLSFGSITKTINKFDAKGIVKSSFSLILIAKAIDILADAMEKVSKLSLKEIGKGLIAIGGGLVELCAGVKIIGKTKISLSTSIAILALAESCKILGDALQKFGQMSWDEIKHGLVGMGGALGEVVLAVGALNKLGGGGSLLGGASVLITVQSLEDLAAGLKKFGEMSWDEIKRGLTAMGGALGEVAVVVGTLGKLAGFSSIFASGSILIVVQGLDDLAESLKKFGQMTWDEIKHGLVGMGGALTEVVTVTGVLGKLAGFSSIFASGAILIVIQGLDDLAESLKKFGQMSWDEIKHGLVGMGGALGEVSIITGTLGKLTGLSGILGGGALLTAIQGLGDLADALKKFGGMTWDEIKHGLVGMGGALGEVAIITGALGGLAGLPALLGSGSILLAVQGLGDLADAFRKFGEMSWDEIKHGLAAMGAALGELALGGLLNTLSIIGSYSISEMAEPLGILADSVKKWTGVTVPKGLGLQLASLAAGVTCFTFGGLGALAISGVAVPLGDLANSVKKWTGVTVPSELRTQLAALADGVSEFTFGGMGASAIADMGKPLGDLAISVSKWKGVTVPTNIKDNMTQLADGIKAFSWAFMGGWSINAIVEPLGALPDSIKKWNGITIPDGLKEDLEGLASAIKSFTWAFVGGWSIDTIAGPLGNLAGAVKKWNGVTIPSDMGTKLKSLASGVKSFSGISDISTATSGMKSIASSAVKLAGVNYGSISKGLNTLSSSIESLGSIDTSGATAIASVRTIISSVVDIIKRSASKFSTAGSHIMNALSRGIESKRAALTNAINNLINLSLTNVRNKVTVFQTTGKSLMTSLITGISSQSSKLTTAFTTPIIGAVTAVRGYRSNFYSAGGYLVDGFAAGIDENTFKAEAQAVAMAKAALQAAEEALGIASPSKEFYGVGDFAGQGFVNALADYASTAYNAGFDIANYAKDGLSNATAKVQDAISNKIDARPTIRPVLDLSDVKSGVSAIGSMFNGGTSVGVMANVGAISSMMNSRQNGNDDVVSAINKLRKDLGNIGNTSYSINGITYDDGSAMSDAVKAIVREARIGRRV